MSELPKRSKAQINSEKKYGRSIEQFSLKFKPDDPLYLWLKSQAESRGVSILQVIKDELNKARTAP